MFFKKIATFVIGVATIVVGVRQLWFFLGQLRLTATIVNIVTIVITSNVPVSYSHKCKLKTCLCR